MWRTIRKRGEAEISKTIGSRARQLADHARGRSDRFEIDAAIARCDVRRSKNIFGSRNCFGKIFYQHVVARQCAHRRVIDFICLTRRFEVARKARQVARSNFGNRLRGQARGLDREAGICELIARHTRQIAERVKVGMLNRFRERKKTGE